MLRMLTGRPLNAIHTSRHRQGKIKHLPEPPAANQIAVLHHIRVNIDAVGHLPPELAGTDIAAAFQQAVAPQHARRGGTNRAEIFAQFIVV